MSQLWRDRLAGMWCLCRRGELPAHRKCYENVWSLAHSPIENSDLILTIFLGLMTIYTTLKKAIVTGAARWNSQTDVIWRSTMSRVAKFTAVPIIQILLLKPSPNGSKISFKVCSYPRENLWGAYWVLLNVIVISPQKSNSSWRVKNNLVPSK